MDNDEARMVLNVLVAELRLESYAALVARYLDESVCRTVVSESGGNYQVEVQAFFDGGDSDDLRVLIAIDDGGWRAVVPLCTDFIVAEDGSFVGE